MFGFAWLRRSRKYKYKGFWGKKVCDDNEVVVIGI